MKNPLIVTFSLILMSGLIYFAFSKFNKFPNFKYDHAVLFTIDGKVNRTVSSSDSSEELLRINIGTDGESFIDSKGFPIHSHYRTRELSKVDIGRVNKCINQTNFNDNMTTECIPIYRDVIVYYSKMNEPIAWLSICFECKKLYLTTKNSNSKFKTGFKIVDCLESQLKGEEFEGINFR